jgi:hypothetical protein
MRERRKKPVIFGITTDEWKKASEITLDPRGLKKLVREYNDSFGIDSVHQYYIISGSYGYKLTRDKDEIMASIAREERLAKIRFKQAKDRRKHAEEFFSRNTRLPI